jgi:hypothetical protein
MRTVLSLSAMSGRMLKISWILWFLLTISSKVYFRVISFFNSSIAERSRNVSTPPYDVAPAVLQHRGADADGYAFTFAVHHIDGNVNGLLACENSLLQSARALANIGVEDVEAFPSYGLSPGNTGYPLGSLVEGSDHPVSGDGEDTVGDAVENGIHLNICARLFFFMDTLPLVTLK